MRKRRILILLKIKYINNINWLFIKNILGFIMHKNEYYYYYCKLINVVKLLLL